MDTALQTYPTALPAHPPMGLCALPELGVIRAEGEDAASFLHGQLTQDMLGLGLSQARLAAYCSAKGRMLASFVVLKAEDHALLLLCSRDLLPATLKRLSMFVLRAKVKLSDASDRWHVHGWSGPDLPESLRAAGAWTRLALEHDTLAVRLPTVEAQPRALLLLPAGAPAPAPLLPDASTWSWLEVRSGVATLGAALVDALVPQMLNYESVGGVNFKKGCYPGQEVVARSQFRGTLKRRAYVVHSEAELQPAQELFHSADPEQPAGVVVQVAAAPGGGWDAIVSMQTRAADGGQLTLGNADGPPLSLRPLPYNLLPDV